MRGKHIHAAIDIGSDKIKLVVGEIYKEELYILCALSIKSNGVLRGVIKNTGDVVVSIRQLVDEAEDMLGVEIENVIVGIPGNSINLQLTKGHTPITNENYIVKGEDVIRALTSSTYKKISTDKELISVIPLSFTLDNHEKIIDPKGMMGKSLEVESLLISADKEIVYDTIKVIEKTGLKVMDIALSPYVDSLEVSTDIEKEEGQVIINIGDDITSISLFEQGILKAVSILHLGGINIVKDLSFIYKISNEDSHHCLKKYGVAVKELSSDEEIREYKTVDGKEITINHHELSEVIEERVLEILKLTRKEIEYITKNPVEHVTIINSSVELEGIDKLAKEIIGIKSKTYQLSYMGARDSMYTTSIGLIKYFYNKLELRNKYYSSLSIDAQKDLVTYKKKLLLSDDNVLGKIFGFFVGND